MAKSKLATGFTRYRDTELEIKASFIVDCMEENPNFKTPVPALTIVSNAINTYVVALRNAESGGKATVAIKNEERKNLEDLLTKLSLYVEAYANNNEVILLSSGFSLIKERGIVGVLPKPHNFSANPTEKGSIALKLASIHRAGSYLFEYRLANTQNPWQIEITTKSSLKIIGLQSGEEYEFRVAGVGTDPDRVYSDIISSFII